MITANEASKLKQDMHRELNANPAVVLTYAAGWFLVYVLIVAGASWHRYQDAPKPLAQEQSRYQVPVSMNGADEADLALGETIPLVNVDKGPAPLAIAGAREPI